MLSVENITKTYEGQPLLKKVAFGIDQDETVCLLGPSGSGKSTLLRIIAGLEEPEAGKVFWEGEDLRLIPAHQRRFGLMFQDYALFPHRNVAENIAFGLRMQNLPKPKIDRIVADALQRINMSALPANISYLILKAVGQDAADEKYMVLMGPLSLEQLAEMGMVKDSSITKK